MEKRLGKYFSLAKLNHIDWKNVEVTLEALDGMYPYVPDGVSTAHTNKIINILPYLLCILHKAMQRFEANL